MILSSRVFTDFPVQSRLVIATRTLTHHTQQTLRADSLKQPICGQVGPDNKPSKYRNFTVAVPQSSHPTIHCNIWVPVEDIQHVTITNLGSSIEVGNGNWLHHDESQALLLPAVLRSGDTSIELFWQEPAHPFDPFLCFLPPHNENSECKSSAEGPAPSAKTLSSWLKSLGDLQRSVAGSHEFFSQAAKAVFKPGGLDGGMILLPSGDGWTIAASHLPDPTHVIGFRSDLVEQSVNAKTTIFHNSSLIAKPAPSTTMHSTVASPAFDGDGNVIAVIYGFRSQHSANSRHGIRLLEAQFVQVISNSVAAAMNRMEAEANAARSRALLDQTFSPAVARNLENDPRFLEGRSTEVTVLFADLRGFSTISEKVGAKVTYELLTDVMDCFSTTISDHDGVVIDFFGDGLSAFWNAPIRQPEHPLMACLCARTMVESLMDLNRRWERRLGRTLKVGIGIHTGTAQVGNAGSRTRLKYGPQGNTVNLASRIEGTTRHVGCPIVVSTETASRVEGTMPTRRICKTRLSGIQKPVDLYQIVVGSKREMYADRLAQYDKALSAFETSDFQQSILLLSEIQLEDELDSVEQFLLQQAIGYQDGSILATDQQGVIHSKPATIAIPGLQQRQLSDF